MNTDRLPSLPDFSEDEKKQFKLWNEGRLLLFPGHTWTFHDVLSKITASRHCDAQWLSNLSFEGIQVSMSSSVQQLCAILDAHQGDSRAKCFLGILRQDTAMIKEAAQDGYEFAQCVILFPFAFKDGNEPPLADDSALTPQAQQWRWTAAEKGEPEAIMSYVRAGVRDVKFRRNMIRFAASLGHMEAIMAAMKSKDPLEAWFWRLSFWETGISGLGLSNLDFVFRSVVPFATGRFLAGTDPAVEARIIFLFGRFMDEKNLSHSNKKVFGGRHSHLTFKLAVWAREFFDMQCRAARKAVDTWCLMACRINSKVNRDIRKKIGMMIWEARDQAEYDVVQKLMTKEELDQ